jgi:formyl-CoA transferase
MNSATRGQMQVVAQPVKLQRTPSRIARATPERGEHSSEILAELGFSADEISALREQSIV